MSHDSQRNVPAAFVAVFTPAGRLRPSLSWPELLERHELCEDLAQSLVETARHHLWTSGITEGDVLDRIAAGLPGCGLELTAGERHWVSGRLAELLGWAAPENAAPPTDSSD